MSDAGSRLDTKLLAVLEDNILKFQSFHFLRRVLEVERGRLVIDERQGDMRRVDDGNCLMFSN